MTSENSVPDEVLLKAERLAEEEFAIMRAHSERGAQIVQALHMEGTDVVAKAILHHHECFDGTGYPHGLKGEEIPLMSRIITIADNYDAMATRRVYHEPRAHLEIMDVMLSETGHKHDPALFEVFVRRSTLHRIKWDKAFFPGAGYYGVGARQHGDISQDNNDIWRKFHG